MVGCRRILLASVASGIMSLCAAANGGDIYNNLPPHSTSGGTDPVSSDGPSYNSFSTGHSTSTLLSVSMMLSGIPTTPGTPQFTVSLLSDSSASPANPGTLIATLGTFYDSTLSTTASEYDIPLTSYGISLTADTRYWVELSSTVGGPASSVAWDYASSAAGAGIQGEYWASTYLGDIKVTSNTAATPGPYQMAVTTTQTADLPPFLPDPGGGSGGGGTTPPSTVPEPGTLCQALSALGIGVIEFARRRSVRLRQES